MRLTAVLGLAAAYFVTGKLGLLLAVPPGYATAVWPPSGIALAGMLILGYRAWPGVLLGSFLVNVGVSFDTGSAAAIVKSLAVAASIGAGAALQALAGAFLIRRFVGFPTALDDERDVGTFLVLGGPVSSVVNATWSVSTLFLAGVVSAHDYLFGWWTWWVGDSIGILIVTPLVLAWAAEPRDSWRRRRLSVSIPLCAAFAMAAFVFVRASAWEQERIRNEFVQRAESIGDALRRSLGHHLEVLESIGDFRAGSPSFGWPEFRAFVAGPLERYPGFRAVSWNPRVLDRDRAEYEAALKRDAFADAGITERNAEGQLVPAARRNEHVFVRYIEPHQQNRPALGYDVASDPTRRDALDRARDSGKPVATARIQLVQDVHREPGFLVFLPVYRNRDAGDTLEERRAALVGYMTGVFRVTDLVASAVRNVDSGEIEVALRDTSASGSEQFLYSNQPPRHDDAGAGLLPKSKGIVHEVVIDVAGRRWVLTASATSRYLEAHRSWQAWTVLAAGLVFTGLLGAFLLVITGRTTRVEQLAGRLQIEAEERRRAETRVARLNRVHAVLSGINGMMIRVRDRDELFREACRIAVELGKFRLAYIGLVDTEAQRVRPAAWAGDDPEFARRDRPLRLPGTGQPEGGASRAVRTKLPAIQNAIQAGADGMTYPEEALKRGYRAAASLPLLVGDNAVGVLGLFAGEPNYFDAEEVELLRELASDISFALDHLDKEKRLDYLAYYDSLTGLSNRALFHEHLEQFLHTAERQEHKLALLILDIERFKSINDAYGRQAGDALLKQVAERLVRSRGDPTRVARLSADHFAVVLPRVRTDAELARRIESRLEEFFGPPYSVAGTELRISARIGISLYPSDAADTETLFKNAESALKKAKQTGERYLFYAQEMTERVAEKLSLENKLRQALDNEEFVLHYQPKVELDTRRIVGVEALIRWQSAELGLVPPIKFIPLLEETGLILPVGSWALKRASLDHRAWVEQKLKPPRVAVNVSPIQLRQRDFVGVVEQAIIDGVAPAGIDLEITESLIMEDLQGNIEKLKSIRGLGVNIAIDDFGTGYSSLGYLAKLPVQSLKIDRSFIVTMLDNPDTMAVVQTIISLAHSLRLTVVAEGVDSEEQAKVLRLLRCDEMQGYLFSKPIPAADFVKLLPSPAA